MSGGARVAVIGDVGGHLDTLRTELRRLGADEHTGRLPDDLVVVQVGDLVHRGPDSAAVVALVDDYLARQPGQWIQLVGNHEAQYLRDPVFEWPERISTNAGDTLRRWWTTGHMRVAACLVADGEDLLVTHAGVTAEFWRDRLGAPADARRAARAVNGLVGVDDAALFRPGLMLRGRRRGSGPGPGPLWASAAGELLPGWLARQPAELPFSQVHGHDSLYDWSHGRFRDGGELARRTVLDVAARHEVTELPGGRIIGIDPCHGSSPCRPWRAFEIRAEVG